MAAGRTARAWGATIVGVLAILAGVLVAAYLWRDAHAPADDVPDAAPAQDAAADARVARGKGKGKGGKKRGRGKPRAAPRPGTFVPRSGAPHAGGAPAPVAHGGAHAPAPVPGPGAAYDDDGEDDDDEPAAPFHPPFRGRGPAGPTYEAALASNKQQITIGGKNHPDLTDAQLAGPMRGGGFVGECGAPESMKVAVKVAVKLGHPVGVSVATSPADPDIAGCIDRYVRTFSWPSSPKMDSFTTTY